jgi:hypothetical protein
VALGPDYAWNHGDFSTDINTTWLGLVGPGVRHLGVTNKVWSDHTDIRPTMLTLTGLRDDYRSDGVVLTPFLTDSALPGSLRGRSGEYAALAAAYKQLNAGVGQFAAATLVLSNKGVSSASAGDQVYAADEAELASLGAQRDAVAAQIAGLLDSMAFGHRQFDNRTSSADSAKAGPLLQQADLLITRAKNAAA